jgi:hypothetical protein
MVISGGNTISSAVVASTKAEPIAARGKPNWAIVSGRPRPAKKISLNRSLQRSRGRCRKLEANW